MNHRSRSHRRLLALVAALPLLVSTLGCSLSAMMNVAQTLADISASFREVGTTKFTVEQEPFAPKLKTDDRSAVYPGDRVKSTISPDTEPGLNSHMWWTPPTNAGDFTFSRDPENPNGPPPFRWTYSSAEDEVEINYTAFHAGSTGGSATEVLEVANDAQIRYTKLTYPVRSPSSLRRVQAEEYGDLRLPVSPVATVAATQVITAWSVMVEMSAPVTLTQQSCEALQGEDVYFALRLPTPLQSAPDEAVSLPLLHFGASKARMSIMAKTGATWSTVVTNTLTLRSTRLDALANHLPAAENETWLALGAASVKPCPEGLDAREWRIAATLFLDSASVPAGSYPLFLCVDADPVGPGAAPTQACLGPQSLTLTDWSVPPPFVLNLSASAVTTPTQRVQIAHQISKHGDEEVSLTLENRSNLEGVWAMFHDREVAFEPTEPDFTRPITPGTPLDMAARLLHFWVVKTIPADTVPGQYSVAVTATQLVTSGVPWVATAYDTIVVAADQAPLPDPPPCTPLTGLTLTHSDQRDALGHTFTITGSVTPPTATLPVSYTIQVDGVTQQTTFVGGHAQAITVMWEEAGVHTVSIAARACGQLEPLQQAGQVEAMGRLEVNTLFLPAIQRLE